ncbi:MAG TPA: O-antigen ligase family protein [Phascolarctobacterium faecium]|uniref:O-antigen ligase family protein n=1 Tax=Phascolarctobacterium faecium TaxID=33025 RepID=UPI0024303E04|nr:O-antigen ligase family protein [Phascolarctobacterium faecium]HJI09563.1 O-antigen ligase family protein [Phascolarctobacterium faecium]
MKKILINRIFFCICFLVIFNNIPEKLQMNFWGGPIGGKLVFYPLTIGVIYTLYCQYKYKNILVHFDKFLKFCFLYIGIMIVSLIIGLYNYPYYDVIFHGPVDQIEKLPRVLAFFTNYGININYNVALLLWIVARTIKSVLLEFFWCFGGSYMIFCWYYNNWQVSIKIMSRAILIGLIIIFSYSFIELFYMSGNVTARNILEIITPYFHPIKTYMGWHPPLLWNGQVRSIFIEPSYVGNYIAIAIPVLLYCYFQTTSKHILLSFGYLTFLVFLTQARTAYGMLLGMMVLLIILLLISKKMDLLIKTGTIFCVLVLAFVCSVKFIDYTRNARNDDKQTKIIAAEIINNNLISLTEKNKRSNGARYALIKSNLRIVSEYPIFGVGKGLASAYIVNHFTEKEKRNREVSMWVSYQKKYGSLSSKYSINSAFNEYITIMAQTGILGLSIFIFPFIWLVVNLFDLYKKQEYERQLDVLLILFALISLLASGINTSITVFYSSWILLGVGFAVVYSEKICVDANKTS